MRSYTIHETLTPKRLAWLQRLAAEGIASRTKSNVGYHCMKLGWTQWALRRDGVIAGRDDAPSAPGTWDEYEFVGEMLTDAGRAMLMQGAA